MRVLKSLLTFIIVFLLLALTGGLITREVLLLIGTNKIKLSLEQISSDQLKSRHVNQCLMITDASAKSNADELVTYQLRFTSNTEYVTEAVCDGFSLSPIAVHSEKLPPLVEKVPGRAGIIWGDYASGVSLDAMGRRSTIYVENKQVNNSLREMVGLAYETDPTTSCSGYGFYCCTEGFEQGMGDQLLGVADCPDTCYSSCQERPSVLSFNSRPFFDPETRTVSLPRGESIAFSYVVSDSQEDSFGATDIEQANPLMYAILSIADSVFSKQRDMVETSKPVVTVSFGDGESETLEELQGMVNHAYTCTAGSCRYSAKVTARSASGVESADNILGKINVVVQ